MSRGTFDTLNDALFAQLDKLQGTDTRDKENLARVIEQTQAVSALAGNIIANANTAVNAMKAYDSLGMKAGDIDARVPRMLGGGQQ